MMWSPTSFTAPFTNNAGDDYGNTDVDIDGDENMDDNDDESHLHHRPLYYKASHHLHPQLQGPRCILATGRSENNNRLGICHLNMMMISIKLSWSKKNIERK